MDSFNELLNYFGFSVEQFVGISIAVWLIIEWIKTRWSDFFTGGWKTQIMAGVVSLGINIKVFYPDWFTAVVCAFFCFIVPSEAHKVLKIRK
jgi:hypothetical protein